MAHPFRYLAASMSINCCASVYATEMSRDL